MIKSNHDLGQRKWFAFFFFFPLSPNPTSKEKGSVNRYFHPYSVFISYLVLKTESSIHIPEKLFIIYFDIDDCKIKDFPSWL